MAHFVSIRSLIIAGSLTLAAVGGSATVGLDHPTAQAAAVTSCASGSVTTVPFTYLVAHFTIGSAECATAAAQVYAATLPQTNFLHYLPYTNRVQGFGTSPAAPAAAAVPAASLAGVNSRPVLCTPAAPTYIALPCPSAAPAAAAVPAASLAGVNSRPVLCTPAAPTYIALPCPSAAPAAAAVPAASLAHAVHVASCASGSVTTVPFTYLVAHFTIGSAECATAAAQVYAATLPQTNFLHYLPYTNRVLEFGSSPLGEVPTAV